MGRPHRRNPPMGRLVAGVDVAAAGVQAVVMMG